MSMSRNDEGATQGVMSSRGDDPGGRAVESPRSATTVTYTYDSIDRWTDVSREEPAADRNGIGNDGVAEPPGPPATPGFAFEHDEANGVFRLTWPDGKVEVFRDNPARSLRVEPGEAGVIRPVVIRGQPAYLYLAPEAHP